MRGILVTLAAAAFTWGLSPARAEDVLVAVAGPMSGPFAAFGAQMKAGAEAAVAGINAQGGVLGKTLVVETADDGCEIKGAVESANGIAGKAAKLVVGHFCAEASIAAARIYEEEGIVLVSPATTAPAFTDQGGWNVIRLSGRDDAQGAAAGARLARDFAGKRVAIVHDGTPYGSALAESARRVMNAAGLIEVLYEAYPAGDRSYPALATRLRKAEVDAVYVGGRHAEAGLIVRDLRGKGSKAVLLSADALLTQAFWVTAGKAGEGTLFTFSRDATRSPSATAALERLKAAGATPDPYAISAYAAVEAWAQGVAAAGTLEGKAVAAKLRSGLELDTALGKITLDPKGDLRGMEYDWYVWSKGSIYEVPGK